MKILSKKKQNELREEVNDILYRVISMKSLSNLICKESKDVEFDRKRFARDYKEAYEMLMDLHKKLS